MRLPTIVLSLLLSTLVAAAAQAADTPAAPAAPTDDPVAHARATSCTAFLGEVAAYRLAGDAPGRGRFGIVWNALLTDFGAKYGTDAAVAKTRVARRVFDNTVDSCRRVPSRTLGATVEGEFYRVR
jgi:hypothetical protein